MKRLDFTRTALSMERMPEVSILLAIQRGLTLVLPLIIAGALALLLLNLRAPGFHDALDALFGRRWRDLCQLIQQGSFGIASLAVLINTGASYATQKGSPADGRRLNPSAVSAVCLSSYFVLAVPYDGKIAPGFFSLGGGGFPIALCVALTSAPLFLFFFRRSPFNRLLYTVGGDTEVNDALAAVLPGVATIFSFAAVRVLLEAAGLGDLHLVAQSLFGIPFLNAGNTFPTAVAYVVMSQFFWLFGVHGPNLLSVVERDILAPAALANIDAAAHGFEPVFILTKPFLDAFVHIGGSGSTLSLILALLIASRDVNTRRLALLATPSALFNVNEVLLFGLPLVLNPVYAAPFLLAPIIQTTIAYAATAIHLVPMTVGNIHWTAPILFGGYAATGSWAGVVLQTVNLGVGALVYLPFVRMANVIHQRRYERSMEALAVAAAGTVTSPGGRKCIDLPGREGLFARALAADLAVALNRDDQVYVRYQPQVDVVEGRAVGAEALLRWSHPVYGMIPPHVVVALAEDTGLIGRLGLRVLAEACMQHAVLLGRGVPSPVLSVNMSALQFEDEGLVEKITEVLRENGLPPRMLKLEVTESVALMPDSRTVSILQRLRSLGVRVAIDDFGMGHTSLRYLREFPVDTVKIDRSLTRKSADGVNDHIITSIVHLCSALGIQIIVEGVETEEELARFRSHNLAVFQGYLFSKPLSGEEYVAFLCSNPKSERTITAGDESRALSTAAHRG